MLIINCRFKNFKLKKIYEQGQLLGTNLSQLSNKKLLLEVERPDCFFPPTPPNCFRAWDDEMRWLMKSTKCSQLTHGYLHLIHTDGRRRLSSVLAHTRCLEWCSAELLLLRRCSFDPHDDEDNLPTPWWSVTIRGGTLMNEADELWRRVLTTSSGHVTTAPAVPAILEREKRNNIVSDIWWRVD